LQWRHYEFLHNPPIKRGDILDIGCGPAEFLNECKKIGFSVLGADIAPRNVAAAQELYRIEVVEGGAAEVANKYPNRKFDVISFFEIVEHLADPVVFFREAKKILKPGGFIVMSVPNSARFGGLFEKEENPPNHLLRWRSTSLKNFLQKQDFEEIRITEQLISSEYPLVRGWFSLAGIKRILSREKASDNNHQITQKTIGQSEGSKDALPSRGDLLKKVAGRIRNFIARPIAAILMFPLRLVGVRYWDMYAVARLK
jgi:SAM-dependent methyltransferase